MEKIVFLKWNSYCDLDMIDAFERLGFQVVCCRLDHGIQTSVEEIEKAVLSQITYSRPKFVFSFNFIPNVSKVCQERELPYVSWVYDSPYIHVYSYTVLNPCNHIFLFDYDLYDRLKRQGITTVEYLPLAVNERRLERLNNTDLFKNKFESDISFVGSLYDEKKHRLFDRFQGMESYAKGYLNGIMQAQKLVYGYNFIEELLTPQIVADMEKEYPTDPNALTAMKPEEIYADYVLNRQVTAIERKEILQILGEKFSRYRIRLYTNNSTQFEGVDNKGPVDYYNEMPYVFLNSRINLNISLRSIKTGIPLRAFDIMGCGGFLLSNYQQELLEYFDADIDFVYYNNYEDLVEKVEYYLSHEKERREIAENGSYKVLHEHTMVKRAKEMIKNVLE